jgi:hypothetical protein
MVINSLTTIDWNFKLTGKSMSDNKLDWLAEEILDTFKELGFDQAYIEDKRFSLTGRDRFAILLWCSCLDERCLSALASRRGLSAEDLRITIRTVKSL